MREGAQIQGSIVDAKLLYMEKKRDDFEFQQSYFKPMVMTSEEKYAGHHYHFHNLSVPLVYIGKAVEVSAVSLVVIDSSSNQRFWSWF